MQIGLIAGLGPVVEEEELPVPGKERVHGVILIAENADHDRNVELFRPELGGGGR